jgi:hypothetical protein
LKQSANGLVPLIGGELQAGRLTVVVYDGTQYVLPMQQQVGGFGPIVGLASAATVDLGTVSTHNVGITGTTAITSFGDTAQAAYPIYLVQFQGALTLTSNTPANSPTPCVFATGGCLYLPGSPANIQTANGDVALVQMIGGGSMHNNWAVISYQRISGSPLYPGPNPCGFNHLQWGNGASTTTVTAGWDSATLYGTLSSNIYSGAQSGLTLNTSTLFAAGPPPVGGMDTASAAAGAFVYMYAISNGTAFALLGSANPPPGGPTLPAGYVFSCYFGAIKNGSSGGLLGTQGRGADANYVVGGANLVPPAAALPIISSGATGTACAGTGGTLTAFPVRGSGGPNAFVPTNAPAIKLVITNAFNNVTTVGIVGVAPNATYGTATTTAGQNPIPILVGAGSGSSGVFRINLESASIYACASNVGGGIQAYGWVDAVNAN